MRRIRNEGAECDTGEVVCARFADSEADRYLCEEKREFVLSKQVVRSGTSMKRGRAGAIIEEVRRVAARWRDYAGVLPEHRDRIEKTLRLEAF